jgi:hypothetical protein
MEAVENALRIRTGRSRFVAEKGVSLAMYYSVQNQKLGIGVSIRRLPSHSFRSILGIRLIAIEKCHSVDQDCPI